MALRGRRGQPPGRDRGVGGNTVTAMVANAEFVLGQEVAFLGHDRKRQDIRAADPGLVVSAGAKHDDDAGDGQRADADAQPEKMDFPQRPLAARLFYRRQGVGMKSTRSTSW